MGSNTTINTGFMGNISIMGFNGILWDVMGFDGDL